MGNEIFVRNVEELCKIQGISPAAAMVKAGLSHSYFHNLKKRGNDPKEEPVKKIAKVLGVTPAVLRGEAYVKHSTGRVLMEGGASEPKPVSPGEDGILSLEEVRLILGYRAADPALREMVKRVLAAD